MGGEEAKLQNSKELLLQRTTTSPKEKGYSFTAGCDAGASTRKKVFFIDDGPLTEGPEALYCCLFLLQFIGIN
jgi:hypothetical protein